MSAGCRDQGVFSVSGPGPCSVATGRRVRIHQAAASVAYTSTMAQSTGTLTPEGGTKVAAIAAPSTNVTLNNTSWTENNRPRNTSSTRRWTRESTGTFTAWEPNPRMNEATGKLGRAA